MSKRERERSEGYFAGARMAYEDCANLIDHISDKQSGFSTVAVEHGCDARVAKIVSDGAKTALDALAEAIRKKLAIMEVIISGPPIGAEPP